jgi:hypothetical protein
MFSNMLRDQLLAVLGVHDIESEGHAFLTVLLDSLLDSLSTECKLNLVILKEVAYSSSSSGR